MQPRSTPLRANALPGSALTGTVTPPGDKSISHRALIIGSQAVGTTVIRGLLEGEDVLRTASALQQLGVTIERNNTGDWIVHGVGTGGLQEPREVLDMGNSGTGARLLMGLVTPYPFTTFFSGDASLTGRPMRRIITPMTRIGANITAREGNYMPLAIHGTSLPIPIDYHSPVASAQIKSAILLAGLNVAGRMSVTEPRHSRDHTERMFAEYGIEIQTTHHEDGSATISMEGQQEVMVRDKRLDVPADPSSAAFLAVAALIVPDSRVMIQNVCMNPLRTGLFTTLEEMGGWIKYHNRRLVGGEGVADIEVKYSPRLKAVSVPPERVPSMIDEFPILSVAAAFAKGDTVMHGLQELRVKESDRLSAICDGLRQCGVATDVSGDRLTVIGKAEPPMGGGHIVTRMDHRMAMSFLVMGLATQQSVTVDDIRCIETSYPQFIPHIRSLGAKINVERPSSQSPATCIAGRDTSRNRMSKQRSLVIAIDGPAASGKGSLARRLADHYGYAYLDTGKLYRAVGLKLVYADKDPTDEPAALSAARTIQLDDLHNPRLQQEKIGKAASIVSAMPAVRDALLDYQRQFAQRDGGAILDGRDIGTVVCPDADIKFFITADIETRARRRHKELQGLGVEVVYDSVLRDLTERDKRDQQRDVAPLKAAPDAIQIDTTQLTADAVFDKVMALIDKHIGTHHNTSTAA